VVKVSEKKNQCWKIFARTSLIQSVKQSITFTQEEVDTLKEKAETIMKETKCGLEELNKKIVSLEVQLNSEIEKNIKLEQFTRPGNLRFNNIREEKVRS